MGGLFGVVAKGNCFDKLLLGTDYHSHLATRYGGLAVINEGVEPVIHDRRTNIFREVFMREEKLKKGNKGIGAISGEPQPLSMMTDLGEFAIATNGLITNLDELVNDLLRRKKPLHPLRGRVNQSEVVGTLVGEGSTFMEGFMHLYEVIKGSMSFLLLTQEGIYASGDRFPLIFAQGGDCFAVTSETSALCNSIGLHETDFLKPKEIVLFDETGIKLRENINNGSRRDCSFLWIYIAFPPCDYEDINVDVVRERSGMFLAKRDDVEADLVAGVPDSGTGHAIGYAIQSGIPLRRPLVKYSLTRGRSYTPEEQRERDEEADKKIIPNPQIIRGNRIVLVDDSIVRRTQMRKLLKEKMFPYDPKEVHVRIACPPLMRACRYNISTREDNELGTWAAIADLERVDVSKVGEYLPDYLDEDSRKYGQMIEWLRRDIVGSENMGKVTLRYQRLEDMVEAIGLDRDNLCTYCWTSCD